MAHHTVRPKAKAGPATAAGVPKRRRVVKKDPARPSPKAWCATRPRIPSCCCLACGVALCCTHYNRRPLLLLLLLLLLALLVLLVLLLLFEIIHLTRSVLPPPLQDDGGD